MKQRVILIFSAVLLLFSFSLKSENVIRISTDKTDLIYKIASNGRLYQSYLGGKLVHESDIAHLSLKKEAYITHGMEDYFEPAIRVLHQDGNPSLLLLYKSHTQKQIADGVTKTEIVLQDEVYPVEVKLFFNAYHKENVIKTWTEIRHTEKKPIVLYNYASSMLHLKASKYWLTEFSGDWAAEVHMTEEQLSFGKKIVDTKLGSRASMFVSPFFILALNDKAQEDEGEVILGTIGWTGNFRFTFEVDNVNNLRVISGINPYGSEYTLKKNEVFRTPEFIFSYSQEGTGEASRNFHSWARNHQLKQGKEGRMTLLNNWEATHFTFDEERLISLFDGAQKLGVDMFLLDDGWFGNKYPRNSDRQGLGDWDVTKTKLPNGIARLVQEANKRDLKFGIWIEPEMVNPKSELYEKHKDWVIHLPNRKEYYYRNQLVLDMSNPKVQDYVFNVVDELMTENPGIAYFKWDCNSMITNIYSPYLKNQQSHLYIDHVRGVYRVLERVAAKYPDLPMMLCSGGGGRSDYEALKYFTEFWPSDNTDGIERIYIQWGYSYFFPSKSMAAHVTSWGKQPLKFRVDVAMMGKFGFDIQVDKMSDRELAFSQEAVKNYNRLSPVIWDGDMYRLVSPIDNQHASMMYVSEKKDKAVVFAFDMFPRYSEPQNLLRLKGLDRNKKYKVEEINLLPGQKPGMSAHGKIYSGDYLMQVGIPVFVARHLGSRVVEITEVN